ncbi:N-acetyltransferase [Clostridia bacterium]|nr:N-acetyltransferase [Clostridia bacterium]
MKYFKKLSGEKIYLSPMNIADTEKYAEWFNNPDVTDNFGVTYLMNTLESEGGWLRNSIANQQYNFSIVRQSDDKLLGSTGFMNLRYIDNSAEIYIFIGENEDRGHGYGSEAMRLILEYGFDVLNMHNLMLYAYSFNDRAISLYKRLGFREFGRRREAHYLNGKYHDIIYLDKLNANTL